MDELDSSSPQSMFALSGWIFADLMLVLAVIFMAGQFTASSDETSPFITLDGTPAVDVESYAATATADSVAMEKQSDSHATEMASMQQTATAEAQSREELAQTATAESAELLQVSQTATAESAELLQVSQTATAESAELAQVSPTATAAAQVAAEPSPTFIAIDSAVQEHTINTDINAFLADDAAALADVRQQLADIMVPYANCRIGMVLTFGHGREVLGETEWNRGTLLSDKVNTMLKEGHSEIIDQDARLRAYLYQNRPETLGNVDMEFWFLGPCESTTTRRIENPLLSYVSRAGEYTRTSRTNSARSR